MAELALGIFMKDGTSLTVAGTVENCLSIEELTAAGVDVNNVATMTYNAQQSGLSGSLSSEVNCIDVTTTSLSEIPVTQYYQDQVESIASNDISTQRSFNRLSGLSTDYYQTAAAIQQVYQMEEYQDNIDEIMANPIDPFYDDFVATAKNGKKIAGVVIEEE